MTPEAHRDDEREMPAPAGGGAVLAGLVRGCRPHQWAKNLLVLAAPVAAVRVGEPAVLARAALACALFTVASSGIYLLNDARDAPADRLHPHKARRPVAAGVVSPALATGVGASLAAVSVGAAVTLGPGFAATIAIYVALSVSYTMGLKRIPVLEIILIASGFLLRTIGGGTANHIPLSRWFLVVAAFGALLLVAGKRRSEQQALGAVAAGHRQVLAAYPGEWLSQVVTLSLTATVLGYCLWAFQYAGLEVFHPLLALSAIPFIAAVLRYTLLVSEGHAERPEHLLATDGFVLASVASCALAVTISLYLA